MSENPKECIEGLFLVQNLYTTTKQMDILKLKSRNFEKQEFKNFEFVCCAEFSHFFNNLSSGSIFSGTIETNLSGDKGVNTLKEAHQVFAGAGIIAFFQKPGRDLMKDKILLIKNSSKSYVSAIHDLKHIVERFDHHLTLEKFERVHLTHLKSQLETMRDCELLWFKNGKHEEICDPDKKKISVAERYFELDKYILEKIQKTAEAVFEDESRVKTNDLWFIPAGDMVDKNYSMGAKGQFEIYLPEENHKFFSPTLEALDENFFFCAKKDGKDFVYFILTLNEKDEEQYEELFPKKVEKYDCFKEIGLYDVEFALKNTALSAREKPQLVAFLESAKIPKNGPLKPIGEVEKKINNPIVKK